MDDDAMPTDDDDNDDDSDISDYYIFLSLDQQISLTVQQEVLQAFERFIQRALKVLGRNPAVAEIPVKVSTFSLLLQSFVARS